ncbi:hypothetical protein [Microlunatus flavus]|nr:hypothetical protein [Microlunatus flavus]
MSPTAARTPRRRTALGWIPLVVVVLLVGLVAATGGLAKAPGVGPRRFAVGEPVVLARWVLVVDGVDLVDTTSYGSPSAPTLRVRLRATWTGDATEPLLSSGLVHVVVPGGPPPAADVSSVAAGAYSGGFDPDVERPATLEVVWPDGADETTPRVPAPATVQVVVRDEREAQNFLYADQWQVTDPLGHVDVPVTDSRTR